MHHFSWQHYRTKLTDVGSFAKWRPILINGGLIVLLGSVLVLLLLLPFPYGQLELGPGQVAPQDIVASQRITFESAVLTQQARERAAQAVPDYYDPPETWMRRQQVSLSREIVGQISQIRENSDLPQMEDKVDRLLDFEDINISASSARQLLEFSEEDWGQVAREIPLVLDQAMREDIKENSLPTVRRRVPALISPDLDEDESTIVVELVRELVRPNSFFNEVRTDELREQARETVPVQTSTLERGEMLLRAGDIVTERDVEALNQLGLSQNDWNSWTVLQTLLITATLLTMVVATIYRLRPQTLRRRRESGLLVVLAIAGLIAARLLIVPHDWLPYLFPLAAISMLAALLLDVQIAVLLVFTFALLIGYLSNGNVELMFYSSMGALLSALVVGKAERLTAFLWSGVAVIIGNLLVISALWSSPADVTGTREILNLLLYVVLNGGLSVSIALIGFFALGNLFGITTSLQLMELSRPTHPLLRQLLLKAPGTYHHTILVSNLAERAAEAIGADAFLIRVGAYYHDIGKTVRPYFFTENIADETSPHASLDAKTSAQIIISHVKDGVDLAKKYSLPTVLQDFIWQHHGAQVMNYFYQKAKQEAGSDEEIDVADFTYPGPDPQTKESAIMMLADICEAAVRAERPATREGMEKLVDKLITQRVLDGALSQSDLTFAELETVKDTFVQVLQGVHHPRIKYPAQTERVGSSDVPQTAALARNTRDQSAAPVPVTGMKTTTSPTTGTSTNGKTAAVSQPEKSLE